MEACNLCGGSEWQTLEDEAGTRVVKCACGLVFLTPHPTQPELEQAYNDAYYDPWQHQTAARTRMWERRLHLVSRLQSCPGRLLDVGAGDGTFLELARGHGWEVAGTEQSAHGAARATKLGLSVSVGEVWEAGVAAAGIDVVTCWHVIEHVRDPRRVLQECYRVLRPGGWLVLATPNLDDRIFRLAYWLARRRWPPLYEPGERELHLYCFSAEILRRLADECGFDSIRTGFDRGSAVTGAKRAVNEIALAWYRLTGRNWGIGLELVARRPA